MIVVNEERDNGLTRDQGGVCGMLLREERMTKKCVQIIISGRNSGDYHSMVHVCSLYGFYLQKFSLEMFI